MKRVLCYSHHAHFTPPENVIARASMSFEKSTVILSLRLLTPSENRNGRTFYFEKITVMLSLHLPHSN